MLLDGLTQRATCALYALCSKTFNFYINDNKSRFFPKEPLRLSSFIHVLRNMPEKNKKKIYLKQIEKKNGQRT